MTRLLFATRNSHKTRELAQLLGSDFEIRDLRSLPNVPEIVESGSTFEENAAMKALALSRNFPGEIVIADDSGLEVQALGGAPGVFSARYAGTDATARANVEKLLSELARGNAGDRRARFVCVISVAKKGKLVFSATGVVDGLIATSARGENGFGYDPVFVPRGFAQTFAELSSSVKNEISHRADAVRKLNNFLKTVRPRL
jgi:XTP/dITP diphosphohydrolase